MSTTGTNRFLVEAFNDILQVIGMSAKEMEELKKNKLAREKQALEVIRQSGVPAERWPTFRAEVYHVDDFSGSLAKYLPAVKERGVMLDGTSSYTNKNADGTRTEYPFTIGEFIPTTNTSPLQKVVEVFTDNNGNLILDGATRAEINDLVNYVVSSENEKKYRISIRSKRTPSDDRQIFDVKNVPDIERTILDNESSYQIRKMEEYLEGLSNKVSDDGFLIINDSYRNPRNTTSSGRAFSASNSLTSDYYKYNNVIILSLSPASNSVKANQLNDPNADVIDYDYGQVQKKLEESAQSANEAFNELYDKSNTVSMMPVSGTSIQVVFEFPSNDVHKSVYLYMPDVITVSHSVHRSKIPITTLGETTVTGIGIGTKMVAGSIIKMFNRRDSFQAYIRMFVEERYDKMSQAKKASLLSLKSNISMNEMSDYMLDDLAPFNIHLISMSEYDCVHKDPPKIDSILGCLIINTGKVYSVENLITEETLSFMAKTVVYQDDINSKTKRTLGSDSLTTGSNLLATLRGGV